MNNSPKVTVQPSPAGSQSLNLLMSSPMLPQLHHHTHPLLIILGNSKKAANSDQKATAAVAIEVVTQVIVIGVKVFKCHTGHHAVSLQLLLQCADFRLIVLHFTHTHNTT